MEIWGGKTKMSKQLTYQEQQAIWQRLVDSHLEFCQAIQEFYSEGVDRVSLMRDAFRKGGGIATAVYVLPRVKTQELQQLFDDLVRISTTARYAGTAREAIRSLPREWVLLNIEKAAEPILQQDATEYEYRRILELYSELDHQLTYKLAQRAAEHSDEEIREAGEEFLEFLNKQS